MSSSGFDAFSFFSNFIPGAIAANYLSPGDFTGTIVWGAASMATGTYVFPNETVQEQQQRYEYRVYPFYGAGLGYGVARFAQMSSESALVAALVGAALGYYLKKGSGQKQISARVSDTAPTTESSDRQHAVFTTSATPPRGQSLM